MTDEAANGLLLRVHLAADMVCRDYPAACLDRYAFNRRTQFLRQASIGAKLVSLQVVALANLFESLFSALAYKVLP